MLFLKILLMIHILGDFYFQSDKISKNKQGNNKYLAIHVLIYTILFLPLYYLNTNTISVTITFFSIFIIHFICDYIMKLISKNKTLSLFVIDQMIHLSVIIVFWMMLRETFIDLSFINDYLNKIEVGISFEKIISITLILLIIVKPASILIEKALPKEINKEIIVNQEEETFNFGSLIGILERLIIVLLAILNLWTSIALVFTAKSISRFKQLEDKDFAQKYLIGTLLSLSITLGVLLLFL